MTLVYVSDIEGHPGTRRPNEKQITMIGITSIQDHGRNSRRENKFVFLVIFGAGVLFSFFFARTVFCLESVAKSFVFTKSLWIVWIFKAMIRCLATVKA